MKTKEQLLEEKKENLEYVKDLQSCECSNQDEIDENGHLLSHLAHNSRIIDLELRVLELEKLDK